MPATLLSIVQTVCDELGLQRQSTVINSTALQIRQLAALVNREARELQQNYQWTALQTEFTLNAVPSFALTGDLVQDSRQITVRLGGTAGLIPNAMLIGSDSVPTNTRLLSVTTNQDGTVTLGMSQPATATVVNAPIGFAQDTYDLPIDFDRFITDTWWDRTNRWALMGPDSPQLDQLHRSGIVTLGPRKHFRQIGSASKRYRIWPVPVTQVGSDFSADFSLDFASGSAAPSTYSLIAFEYITSFLIQSAAGAGQPSFLADTDTFLLDEQMLILGVKWRFFQIKGLDYAALQQEAIDYQQRAYANDGGMKTLSMVPPRSSIFISSGNVQDGYFPGNVGPNAN